MSANQDQWNSDEETVPVTQAPKHPQPQVSNEKKETAIDQSSIPVISDQTSHISNSVQLTQGETKEKKTDDHALDVDLSLIQDTPKDDADGSESFMENEKKELQIEKEHDTSCWDADADQEKEKPAKKVQAKSEAGFNQVKASSGFESRGNRPPSIYGQSASNAGGFGSSTGGFGGSSSRGFNDDKGFSSGGGFNNSKGSFGDRFAGGDKFGGENKFGGQNKFGGGGDRFGGDKFGGGGGFGGDRFGGDRQGQQRGEGGFRGRGRGRGGYGGGFGDRDNFRRDFNRGYGGNNFGDRNGGFGDRNGGFGDRNGGFGGGFNRNNGNGSVGFGQTTPSAPVSVVSTPPVETPKAQEVKPAAKVQVQEIIPKSIRCWPTTSIFLLGCKLELTFRENIAQHISDVLFIPFEDTRMLLYPGRVLNSCSFDYRAKIDKAILNGKLKDGASYLQSYKGPLNLKGFSFGKVSLKKNSASQDLFEVDYISGMLSTLSQCKSITNPSFERILIGYSQKYGSAYKIIKELIKELCLAKYESKTFKKVVLTAETGFDYLELSQGFNKNVRDLINENKL